MLRLARSRFAALLAALPLVLVGCGATSGSPAGQSSAESAQTEEAPAASEGNAESTAAQSIILATTTSTRDSGLLDVLLPIFEEETGYTVKPVAVGTGQALALGERGEADALLTHAPASEQKLVDSGAVTNYQLVMHNDFVIVGPPADPAGIQGMDDAQAAFAQIHDAGALFISRGDDSGTHKKERALWEAAGLDPVGQKWYQESGTGMGGTLNIANEKEGYTLTDRATYLNLKKNLDLAILVEGDSDLHNIYHIMQVNPEQHPQVNAAGAKALVEFFISKETQAIIGEYGVEKFGQPLFFPDVYPVK